MAYKTVLQEAPPPATKLGGEQKEAGPAEASNQDRGGQKEFGYIVTNQRCRSFPFLFDQPIRQVKCPVCLYE